jgi:hypothetical protein
VRLGADRYFTLRRENRWLGDVQLALSWNPKKKRRLFLQTTLFRQAYPDSLVRNFRRWSLRLGYSAPLPLRGWSGGVEWEFLGLDYRRTERWDLNGWLLRWIGRRSLGRGWKGEFSFRLGEDHFGRASLKVREEEGEIVTDLGPDQKDAVRALGVTLERYRPLVLRLGYALSWRRSNSFGFSYRRHDLSVLASVALPWDMDLQGLLTLQWTRYTDEGMDSIFVFRSGEEVEAGETNNSLTLRIRRPLDQHWTLELRGAVYRNEGLLLDRFYTKHFLGAALRWRRKG